MLVKVRDELRNQLNAFQSLYDSSIGYGMRHALTAEQKKSEIYARLQELKTDVEQLEEKVDQLNQDEVDMIKADEEERAKGLEKHEAFRAEKDQSLFQLKEDLDTVLSNPNMIC